MTRWRVRNPHSAGFYHFVLEKGERIDAPHPTHYALLVV